MLQTGAQDAYIQAWLYAARAHQGQTVTASGLPYIVHVGLVAMELLAVLPQWPQANHALALQCALLHDTLEDTPTRHADLSSAFGTAVADGVQALTKREDLPKPEAMLDSLRRIRAQPHEVWAVKLADRITNLAPPPAHWSADKVAAYREEAREIHRQLSPANAQLAQRLEQRIHRYGKATA